MIDALSALMQGVQREDDISSLLQQVRKIVYGDLGWDSPYRIDDFERTNEELRLSVGDRQLKVVHSYHLVFVQKQQLRRVA
jgi:hypothetical protein